MSLRLNPTQLPVRDLAQRLGAEANLAVICCDAYQDASAGFFTAAAPTAEWIAKAQDLDRLSQQLRAIACALQGLAQEAPTEWRVSSSGIVEGIGLAEVADRLGGRVRCKTPDDAVCAGELDFF
jgi:hypothetical protein